MSIQLSLNPIHGFGLLLADGTLGEDFRTGQPYFTRQKRTAKHAAIFMCASWAQPQVVEVERHENTDAEGWPTYVIGRVIRCREAAMARKAVRQVQP